MRTLKKLSIFFICATILFGNVSNVYAGKKYTQKEMKADCGHMVGCSEAYMAWQCLTADEGVEPARAKLHTNKNCSYTKNGFGLYNDFYVIAMTDTFGGIGSYVKITYKDKKELYVVVGDTKSQGDPGANKWGHKEGKEMVEYIVNGGPKHGTSWSSNWNNYESNNKVPSEEGILAWYNPNNIPKDEQMEGSKDRKFSDKRKDEPLIGKNTTKNPVAEVEVLGNLFKTPNKKVADFGGSQNAVSSSTGGSTTTRTKSLGGNLTSDSFYLVGGAQMKAVVENATEVKNTSNYGTYEDATVDDINKVITEGKALQFEAPVGMPTSDAEKQTNKYKSGGTIGSDSTKVFVALVGDGEIKNKKGSGKSVWESYKKVFDNLKSSGKGLLICEVPYRSGDLKKGINKQITEFNKYAQKYAGSNELFGYITTNDIAKLKKSSDRKKEWDADKKAYKSDSDVSKEIKEKIGNAVTTYIQEDTAAAKALQEKSERSNNSVKVNGNVYDEDYFITTNKTLIDSPLSFPSADMMTVNEQKQIANWSENIDNEKTTVVSLLRTLIAFLGILVTIYSIFIYLAYWLDRVNNIIPIEVLPTITLGNLSISPDETSTFNPNTEGKKVVIHKDVIKIVVIGCTLGVLLMTGRIYVIISFIWQKFSSLM